ncbi:hypothetical protein PoB_005252100 [Plakobranchus ocellatus]|uniref:Transposable element P transposase-like RNase H domain-containing protein n=1 Tax=Plakobranchus ocellatus TaxID=259542 RepID=A0AAV4BZR1_9GAST|nr:hypothetical protein PoB_005252100 [Plakobranchus ocellatus]
MNEIYIKASLTCQVGVEFGYSVDQANKFATTILCFMVKCLFTRKKFLVKLLLCYVLNNKFLLNYIKDVLTSLERNGARVTAIMNTNNHVIQAFFKTFSL